MLRLWWWALHSLLVAAALLVGWPWPAKLGLALASVAHAALRGPRPTPALLVVGADGSWRVPEWGDETLALAGSTRLAPLAIDLHLGIGPRRRHFLLLADQLERGEWARLLAILRRSQAGA